MVWRLWLKYMGERFPPCLLKAHGPNAAVLVCLLIVCLAFCRLVYLEWSVKLEEKSSTMMIFPSTLALRKTEIFGRRIHYIQRPRYISQHLFSRCQYSCYFTESERLSDTDSDLMVVWRDLPLAPPPKPSNQIWVYHNMEPPTLQGKSYKLWRGLFNWTISYRRDSDIYSPYGIFQQKPRTKGKALNLKWTTKEREIVWFVSNCHVNSLRNEYVSILSQTIDVDVYGKCGSFNCTDKWPVCVKTLQHIYKYYLSLENSLCRDYITEKCFKIYESLFHAIPIVRNGVNLDQYLPPNSYISTKDFHSIEALGKFLTILSNTKTAPDSYFDWRESFVAKDTIDSDDTFCELCRRGHTHDKYVRLYEDIDDWLRGPVDNRFCETVTDI